jgi:hypothetical protein
MVQDAVAIGFALCIVAGVKGRRNRFAIANDNGIRQKTVEGYLDCFGTQTRVAFKTGHLAKGVNAGISASRADNCDLLPDHGLERIFDFLLNGRVPFLPLPTMEAGTVVFNGYLEIAQLHSGHRKQTPKVKTKLKSMPRGISYERSAK